MGVSRVHKTSFAAGEVNPRLIGRGDLRAYENGASKLRNLLIHPTGGIRRRPGMRYVDTVDGAGRMVSFEFNTEQTYLLVFTDLQMDVFKDGVKMTTIVTPWSEAQLATINWTQSADTLLVVHPDVPPQMITRTSHVAWTLAAWTFVVESNLQRYPFYKYAESGVTLTPSATTGTVTLTASSSVFDASHVGDRFRIKGKQVQITAVSSGTVATGSVKQTLAGTSAEVDWEEPAFSSLRGWPVAVVFHQDRLAIGGSRDLPNRLWMSKSSDLFNFDLGTGLDDESIEFGILSDQVNAIRAVFSGRHLQVFTSGAEWMVTGTPLTPSNIQLQRQTRIGSLASRTVPPRDVDGATVFAERTGKDLREFLFADVEQAYQATELAMLADHLILNPVDMDFDTERRILFVVNGDGTVAALTLYRAQQVTAWTLLTTDGSVGSVTTVGDTTYFLVARNGQYFVEELDDQIGLDAALVGTSDPATVTWSGLDHLEGETVTILADGAIRPTQVVTSGAITLPEAAAEISVGLPFAHEVEPLPPAAVGGASGGLGGKIRLISATFRLKDTAALRLDVGRGYVDLPFTKFGGGSSLDAPPQNFTGDKTVRSLGWRHNGTESLWHIYQDAPLPFALLSVGTEIKTGG